MAAADERVRTHQDVADAQEEHLVAPVDQTDVDLEVVTGLVHEPNAPEHEGF